MTATITETLEVGVGRAELLVCKSRRYCGTVGFVRRAAQFDNPKFVSYGKWEFDPAVNHKIRPWYDSFLVDITEIRGVSSNHKGFA